MKAIVYILSTSIALLVANWLIPGVNLEKNLIVVPLAGLVVSFGNFFIKPILKVFSFPLMMATFGLFNFVLSALILWFSTKIIPGFMISGLTALLLTTLVISVFNSLAHILIRK